MVKKKKTKNLPQKTARKTGLLQSFHHQGHTNEESNLTPIFITYLYLPLQDYISEQTI